MVNIQDSTFFWCQDLCRARINFSEEQCLQAVRREAMKVENVDRDYLLSLSAAKLEDFSFEYRYLPVYHFTVVAKYTKNGKSREVEKEGSYFDESLAACRPDFFVGGQSARFLGVNLPRDLEYPLYAANGKGISENEAANRAACVANDPPLSGERRSIASWSGTVCFVPILLVKYTYRGRVYSARVNMHNGTCVAEVPESPRGEIWAARAARTAGKLRRASMLISFLWLIAAAVLIFIPETAMWADVGFAAFAFLHLIFRGCRLPKAGVSYWYGERVASVKQSLVKLNRGRCGLLHTVLLAIACTAAQIVLQFVL